MGWQAPTFRLVLGGPSLGWQFGDPSKARQIVESWRATGAYFSFRSDHYPFLWCFLFPRTDTQADLQTEGLSRSPIREHCPVGPILSRVLRTSYSVDLVLCSLDASFFITPYFFFQLFLCHFPIFRFTLFLGVYAYFSLSLLFLHPPPPRRGRILHSLLLQLPPSSTSPLE